MAEALSKNSPVGGAYKTDLGTGGETNKAGIRKFKKNLEEVHDDLQIQAIRRTMSARAAEEAASPSPREAALMALQQAASQVQANAAKKPRCCVLL